MNMFQKTATALAAISMSSTPLLAATIISPGLGSPVSATGTLTFSRPDQPGNPSFTCSIGLDGSVSSSTPGIITFVAGDIWGTNSLCNDFFIDIDLPLDMTATSSTNLRFASLQINTQVGLNLWHNADFNWSAPTATLAGPRPPAAHLLTLSGGTLTLSPAVTIAP